MIYDGWPNISLPYGAELFVNMFDVPILRSQSTFLNAPPDLVAILLVKIVFLIFIVEFRPLHCKIIAPPIIFVFLSNIVSSIVILPAIIEIPLEFEIVPPVSVSIVFLKYDLSDDFNEITFIN